MNILANDKEFLKYIEIWNEIKDLFTFLEKLFEKRNSMCNLFKQIIQFADDSEYEFYDN